MKLPAFLSGLFGILCLSLISGLLAGFSTGLLIAFVVTVLVVAQFAYVALIAVMSAMNRTRRNANGRTRISRGLLRLLRQSGN